ncbi:MAG: carboxypeptidase-like regulatory domain-containing protein [Acidobacteria bacterium]|nr:carboxypeptidase-like regulatory domain-containing protein [Acidobacteriota bacterium]MCA1608767.1 carboxypeptidase-like regulatory domain-containing protein [Acidobacteriota bacterium]
MGFIPINDLGAGTYNGAQGGLYPGGGNTRPAAHESGGMGQALAVRPLGADGQPSTAGKIVLLSIGMSNTTQEFSTFKPIADGDSQKNPNLVIVDGAQGGRDAIDWADPNDSTWINVNTRLTQAGVSASQVQAVWLKQQIRGDDLGIFPAGTYTLRDALREIVLIAKIKYPNLRVLYLSSRSYGGYSTVLRGTGAYENAFAIKWLIEEQINGDPRLLYTGSNPPAPWIAWGPYFWADGLTPRSDSLTWDCSDFNDDGIHPSVASGRPKVAQILLNFFKSDSTARAWFLNSSSAAVSVSGRITIQDGRGASKALVRLTDAGGLIRYAVTNPFGYYRFAGVPSPATYTLHISHKKYQFTFPQQLTVNGPMENADFTGF